MAFGELHENQQSHFPDVLLIVESLSVHKLFVVLVELQSGGVRLPRNVDRLQSEQWVSKESVVIS